MRFQHPLIVLLGFMFLVLGHSPSMAGDKTSEQTRIGIEPLLSPPLISNNRLEIRRNRIVRAVEKTKGAVVNIHSERTVNGPASDLFSVTNGPNRVNGMGTGIIIDSRGYIVTNHHVVEDVNVIRVRLADGTSVNANVIARSREVDLALLKVDVSRPLPIMVLGTSKDLMVGETVVAIGNAFGYEHTVSRGIVSAVKRDVSLNKEMFYRALIQTDASINPGNSGGPLINIHGELVGVNVAIRAGAQGIGFAIPVDTMIAEVAKMLRSERQQQVADGMEVTDVVRDSNEGAIRQVRVTSVLKGSAAEQAGLETNDLLLKIGSIPIQCSFDVERALLGNREADHLPVVFVRDGKKKSSEIVLQRSQRARPGAADLVWNKLGLKLVPIRKEAVSQVNGQLNGGMQVIKIQGNGLANRSGIQQGDILVGLHQWETLTLDNVAFVLMHPDLSSFNPLSFYIIREGQVRRGWLQAVE